MGSYVARAERCPNVIHCSDVVGTEKKVVRLCEPICVHINLNVTDLFKLLSYMRAYNRFVSAE